MAVPVPETLEKAKEILLEYSKTIEEQTQSIATLQGEIAEKDTTINDLRTLNQKYYLQLAQGTEEPDQKEEAPKESLEDFARKHLGGIIR